MLRYILESSEPVRGVHRVKPGLLFLLRLAWESRTRLPLLLMSAIMALGIRIRLEINIDRSIRFTPRLRLDEAEIGEVMTDDDMEEDDNTDWTTDDAMSSHDGESSCEDDENSDHEEPESDVEIISPLTHYREKPQRPT